MTDKERIEKLEKLLENAVDAYNNCDHVEEMDFSWVEEAETFLTPPLGLLECRQICNQHFNGGKAAEGYLDYNTGRGDDRPKMKAVLAAYKAGLNAGLNAKQDFFAKSKDGFTWSKNV